MPFAVGDYEKHLSQLGVVVATSAARSWKHGKCGGTLTLTRDADGQGRLTPAFFLCSKCAERMNIYPDQMGGVQPALKMQTAPFNGVSDPGDGRWR